MSLPVLARGQWETTFTENGSAVAVDPTLSLTEADGDRLLGAVVAITGGFVAGQDVLAFTAAHGITGVYDASTGRLTFSGAATAAQYQDVLRSVTYANTSDTPNTFGRQIGFSAIVDDAFTMVISADTGHAYEFVSSQVGVLEAVALAQTRSFAGQTGYLATISSEAENLFIQGSFRGWIVFVGAEGWIGHTDSDVEGQFTYLTGPEAGQPLGYTNWSLYQPDDAGGAQDYVYLNSDGAWEDAGGGPDWGVGYFVEYGGAESLATLRSGGFVRVVAVDDAPLAAADVATARNHTSTMLDVLANDRDPEGRTLSIVSAAATNGTAAIEAGKIRFTPDAGYVGPATVTYTITDGVLQDEGSVAVTVLGANTAPTLSGVGPTLTLDENAVVALAPHVSFADDDMGGGELRVSGLLAEDRVALRGAGSGPGQVGMAGSTVSVGGVAVGVFSGGSGADFVVAFNGAATAAAVEAVIEALSFTSVSESPTASRRLLIDVRDADGVHLPPVGSETRWAFAPIDRALGQVNIASETAGAFADFDLDGDLDLLTGGGSSPLRAYDNVDGVLVELSTHPFQGLLSAAYTAPTFLDIDADGDLDLLVGDQQGLVHAFTNTGGSYAAAAANPFSGDVGDYASPAAGDVDHDGDDDLLVVGTATGATPRFFRNDGGVFTLVTTSTTLPPIYASGERAIALADVDGDGRDDLIVGQQNGAVRVYGQTDAGFTERTGAANPFGALSLAYATPTLGDLDGDGRLEGFVAGYNVQGTFVREEPLTGQAVAVTIAPINDAPTLTPTSPIGVVAEDGGATFKLTLFDDGPDPLTVTLVVAHGTLALASFLPAGVTTTGVGAATLTLTGSAPGLSSALGTGLRYVPAADYNGLDTLYATVSEDPSTPGGPLSDSTEVAITVTPISDRPVVTGFAAAVAFAENAVNAEPALLDASVTVVTPDANFDGAVLRVTGGGAEDRVTLLDGGGVTVTGGAVQIGGVEVGTLPTVAGALLTVSLNAAADAAAVEALIERLAYANVSDHPTATRTLRLELIPAGWLNDPFVAAPSLTVIDVAGSEAAVTFGTIGGVPSAIVGGSSGTFAFFRLENGLWTQATGASNPFNGVDIGSYSHPALVDLDDDGDLDLVSGDGDVRLLTFINQGATFNAQAGGTGVSGAFTFTERYMAPTTGDVDGDGDADLLVGTSNGRLRLFHNDPNGQWSEVNGDAFESIVLSGELSPALGDLDNDGDLDLVLGRADGTIGAYRNDAGIYTDLVSGPFAGIDVGAYATAALRDIDGDGDLDALLGGANGLRTFLRDHSPTLITVTVNAELEPITAVADAADVRSGGSVDGDVLDNDAESLDGGALSVVAGMFDGAYGALTLTADGGWTYVADAAAGLLADDVATDVFTYTALDTVGATATAALTVSVVGRSIGAAGADTISGNAAGNTLAGLAGADLLVGNDGGDALDGGADNDVLYGGTGDDDLVGGSGNDRLDGGTGADAQAGGRGDDTYFVDDAGDTTDETGGDGYDVVSTTVDYTVAPGIERLIVRSVVGRTITGSGEANRIDGAFGADVLLGAGGADLLFGGDGADVLDGGDAADRLFGGAGNDGLRGGDGVDQLSGEAGADRLEGGEGADSLDGGAGADVMIGGIGDDTYYVDDAGDRTDEQDGGGADIVVTVVDHTIGVGTERVIVRSAAGRTITGNDEANRVDGGVGADTLRGYAGRDALLGGAGNDTLDGGTDVDSLSGDAGDDTLLGGDGADTLLGGPGKDTLEGGLGADYLTGGADADRFVFDRGFGTDTLRDYDVFDRLAFHAGSFGLTAGTAAPVDFGATAVGPGATFVYNEATRTLFFDADGQGGQAQERLAVFSTPTALTADDFVLI